MAMSRFDPRSRQQITPSLGGSGQTTLFLGGILLILAEWQNVFQPGIQLAWQGKADKSLSATDLQIALGMLVFLIILVFIAESSSEAASGINLFLIALWIVFLVFNGGPVITGFFDFFSGKSSSTTSNNSTSSSGTSSSSGGGTTTKR